MEQDVFILMWEHRFGSDFLGVFSSKKLAIEYGIEYSKEKGYNNSYIVKDILDDPTDE